MLAFKHSVSEATLSHGRGDKRTARFRLVLLWPQWSRRGDNKSSSTVDRKVSVTARWAACLDTVPRVFQALPGRGRKGAELTSRERKWAWWVDSPVPYVLLKKSSKAEFRARGMTRVKRGFLAFCMFFFHKANHQLFRMKNSPNTWKWQMREHYSVISEYEAP